MLTIVSTISSQDVYDIVDIYSYALEERQCAWAKHVRSVTREEFDSSWKVYATENEFYAKKKEGFQALMKLTDISHKTAFDFRRIADRLQLFEASDWYHLRKERIVGDAILSKLIEAQA